MHHMDSNIASSLGLLQWPVVRAFYKYKPSVFFPYIIAIDENK